MTKRMTWVLFVVCAVGCKPPGGQGEGGPAVGESKSAGGFTAVQWEDLTGDLLHAGRNEQVDTFKGYLSPDTVELFEKTWADIIVKIDWCLDAPDCNPDDVKLLTKLKDGCRWDAFIKAYKPGRLVTINPTDDGRYHVTEVTQFGRKMSYLVEPHGEGWRIAFEKDNRWILRFQKGLHAAVDRVLERNKIPEGGVVAKEVATEGEEGAEEPVAAPATDEQPAAQP